MKAKSQNLRRLVFYSSSGENNALFLAAEDEDQLNLPLPAPRNLLCAQLESVSHFSLSLTEGTLSNKIRPQTFVYMFPSEKSPTETEKLRLSPQCNTSFHVIPSVSWNDHQAMHKEGDEGGQKVHLKEINDFISCNEITAAPPRHIWGN